MPSPLWRYASARPATPSRLANLSMSIFWPMLSAMSTMFSATTVGDAEFEKLGGEVEVALEVAGVDDVDDHVDLVVDAGSRGR